MNTTVEKNNPKIFPQNEGKINSKGMVAPPVPPKSSQAKFAGIKAIFERNVPHSQANDSNKTVSSNLGRTFGPTMQKLMEDNIHSTPNKQRRNSGDSGISDIIAFLIIVRTGHRKAESTARRKDSNRGMFFLALFFIANQ
ncbi:hypothetical protein [Wolbachia endosymbiont (group A) of Sphecodes monilicornis]|uniref:hypothetical protein n=1 Tax=Wolbachia endosymbiont (group A) of Sphecodes monilicornis TaxID=2954060 RepID=UPI002226D73B|nr:hypothetical protein [Wolbachia endosymbiont (group A) of Sphecodes monilicornis]